MREGLLFLGIGIITTTLSIAQVKKQFSVDNNQNVSTVDLDFSVNSGHCFLKVSDDKELLTVYGNKNHDAYSHSFNKELNNKNCKIYLHLEDDKSAGLSQSISYRMFGDNENNLDNLWKIFLTDDKQYDLNLKYGIGTANIDLTNITANKIKINTGSADVNIRSSDYNKIVMDTFLVKVDMGSVKVSNINLSKANSVIADVGFGDLILDFSDKALVKTNIIGSVGAGNLLIILPSPDTPVKVKISDSWLCKVQMLRSFKLIEDNTYVNHAYDENAPNLMTFDIDVSMGKIIFKE